MFHGESADPAEPMSSAPGGRLCVYRGRQLYRSEGMYTENNIVIQ